MDSSSLSLQTITSYESDDEVVLSLEDNDNGDNDFVFLDMPCRRRDSCLSDREQALPEAREASETLNPDTTDEAAAEAVPPTPSPPPCKKKGRAKVAPKETPSTAKQSAEQKTRKRSKRRNKANKAAATKEAGLGTAETTDEMYQEASEFITSFLANPAATQDWACRLTLLQSLIVELGLVTAEFPTSLRSARAFIKARVFINIREYIAHRGKDQATLQSLLYPSKKALIKDIKRKRETASRKWVKEHGLQVLLVECFHH